MDFLETKRLIVRSWDPQRHAADAYLIYSDPEVVKYLKREPEPSIVAMRKTLEERLARYEHYRHGIGNFALIEKSNNRVIGALLLKYLPGVDMQATQDLEIGWHLARRTWGLGYATEGAAALLDYGFRILKASQILAVAFEANQASLKVMERIGMTRLGLSCDYYGGEELVVYKKETAVKRRKL